MSFDLDGWAYVNPKWPNRKLAAFFPVIGANHSDVDLGFLCDLSADEEATFEEQVQRVISRMKRYDCDVSTLSKFEQDALEFRNIANAKGYDIISCWI